MSVGVRAGMRAVMPAKSSGNARDAPTRLGTVPRKARRRGGNEPVPVSSPEDIAPTASEASSTSGSAPTIDSEAVVSSRGADIVVPGAEGNEERLAKTASDATELTASTENAEDVDVIDDKDVEEGKVKAETSREGPAGGAANAGHEGAGHSVQVNTDPVDRSSAFGGSVSKTPIRPHASGGLGRVVTRSSSPPLSSSSRKRRTAALAAVRAAARAASTASDGGSWSSATDATDEDDSEVTGPSPNQKKVTFANDENIREHSRTIANDENAAPPRPPRPRLARSSKTWDATQRPRRQRSPPSIRIDRQSHRRPRSIPAPSPATDFSAIRRWCVRRRWLVRSGR